MDGANENMLRIQALEDQSYLVFALLDTIFVLCACVFNKQIHITRPKIINKTMCEYVVLLDV